MAGSSPLTISAFLPCEESVGFGHIFSTIVLTSCPDKYGPEFVANCIWITWMMIVTLVKILPIIMWSTNTVLKEGCPDGCTQGAMILLQASLVYHSYC